MIKYNVYYNDGPKNDNYSKLCNASEIDAHVRYLLEDLCISIADVSIVPVACPINKLDTLIALNDASLILANKRAAISKGWAHAGSQLDEGRRLLDNAQRYISHQAEVVGIELNS